MKTIALGLLVFSASTLASWAQLTIPVTPATPRSFKSRATGASMAVNATVLRPGTKSTLSTPASVTSQRIWRNREGKVITAKLLAFDDAKREVIRDGKVRLLKNGDERVYLVALSQLADEDQTFVRALTAPPAPQAKPASAGSEAARVR